MKAVNFQTLLSMPAGTVFTKYPLGMHELLIKGEPEDGTFNVQHFSDTIGEGGELFDPEISITGESFDLDTDRLWVDDGLGIHGTYIVYSLGDVGKVIQRLMKAMADVKEAARWHPAGKPDLAAEWERLSPEAKANISKEALTDLLRITPRDMVEVVLRGVPLETAKAALEAMVEELAGKPSPTMPNRDQRFEVKGDVMDLIKNVGGPGFNEAHTRLYQAQKETTGSIPEPVEATTTANPLVGANGVIVEAVKAAGGVVWDDHGPTGTKTKLWGVATLDKGGKQQVVALHGSDYFSVNKLYVYKGEIHLSTESVGGVVSTFKHGSVEAAIEAYNEEQKTAIFSCGTLNNVVKF